MTSAIVAPPSRPAQRRSRLGGRDAAGEPFLARQLRTVRTMSHLRSSQVIWRMMRLAGRLRPERLAPAPAAIGLRDDLPAVPAMSQPGDLQTLVRQLAAGQLELLGRTQGLGTGPVDWRLGCRSDDRLGTVTLHYHEWLWRLAAGAADASCSDDLRQRALELMCTYLDNWLVACDLQRPGSRHLAWNGYAIATRIGWWVRMHGAVGDQAWQTRGELRRRFLCSLWQQASHLHRHLEWDLRGNHLLRDAVGLAWAGRFFDGSHPRRWLDAATRLAVEQAHEQVMADGGHFERSPMYHLHVMQDLLTLAMLVEDEHAATLLRQTWQRMALCLQWLRHPDGQIALLNDAALEAAAHPLDMFRGGRDALEVHVDPSRPHGGRHFDAWGLAVWHGRPWSVFFDIGPIGPDYQPGHAHADTLGIECSCRGKRLFVDPGAFAYDHDAIRAYDVSTAAHNTVCIDGADSSEMWHMFRVGRRARPGQVSVHLQPDRMRASASHDGYRFLPGRARHTRTLTVQDDGPLAITDRIDGRGEHHVAGSLLLDPRWRVVGQDRHGWKIVSGGDRVIIAVSTDANLALHVEPAPYHPRFGVELQTTRLVWSHHGPLPIEVRTIIVDQQTDGPGRDRGAAQLNNAAMQDALVSV